jgi:predicted metal-dependent phosphoesterase TrpH
MHSTASDGTIAPEDLPAAAQRAGLEAMALTDHDTTAGVPGCAAAAAALGIAFVPGIEISADPGPPPGGRDDQPRRGTLHMLGLFVRHDAPELLDVERRMKAARDSRNPAIVERLAALGVRISYEEVLALSRDQGTHIIGRPHIAQVLVSKGYVKSVQDAFARYIGQGQPAYVRRDRMPAADAIAAIHAAGGLAIMAHPVQLGRPDPDDLEYAVKRLLAWGLDGIEIHHSDHTPALVRQYRQLADRLGLLVSGGSDFHGERKPVALGSQNVPIDVYHRLHQAWVSRSRGSSASA